MFFDRYGQDDLHTFFGTDKQAPHAKIFRNIILSGNPLNAHIFWLKLYKCTPVQMYELRRNRFELDG